MGKRETGVGRIGEEREERRDSYGYSADIPSHHLSNKQ